MAKCKKCGSEMPDGIKFCGKCGNVFVPEKNICKSCGMEMPDTAKCCGNCGTVLGVQKTIISPLYQTERTNVPQDRSLWQELAFPLSVVLIIIGISAFLWSWVADTHPNMFIAVIICLIAFTCGGLGIDRQFKNNPVWRIIAFVLSWIFVLIGVSLLWHFIDLFSYWYADIIYDRIGSIVISLHTLICGAIGIYRYFKARRKAKE